MSTRTGEALVVSNCWKETYVVNSLVRSTDVQHRSRKCQVRKDFLIAVGLESWGRDSLCKGGGLAE